jgi:hypothetical protein
MNAARFETTVRVLDKNEVRYVLVGPLAVVAHGCMPATDKVGVALLVAVGGGERTRRCLAVVGGGRKGEVVVSVEERQDFDELYARKERFELAAGVVVSVCGYGDLVRLKRLSGGLGDLADLDQLEKVRRVRPAYDPWYECTFEGNELWGLWRWADLTLAEKIRSLEESRKVGRMFQEARQKRGLKSIVPDGRTED